MPVRLSILRRRAPRFAAATPERARPAEHARARDLLEATAPGLYRTAGRAASPGEGARELHREAPRAPPRAEPAVRRSQASAVPAQDATLGRAFVAGSRRL